jgi:hypothetical protein
MSYLNKNYIDLIDDDYTSFVNSEKDAEMFNRMIEHQKRTVDVPVKECIKDVVSALNLGRDLRGIKAKVIYQADPKLN